MSKHQTKVMEWIQQLSNW